MTSVSRFAPAPLVDWGKALASQLIVWHHLCFYGPLAAAAMPLAPDVLGWLADPARQAVQVFLVIGGFLAARSLMPTPDAAGGLAATRWPALLGQRFLRLARPAWPVMVLAVVCAALARAWMDDPDTPDAPTLPQVLANALFLQDIVGTPALSAGWWYLAIDLQLYALLAVVSVLLGWLAPAGPRRAWLARFAVGALTATSITVWNLDAELDPWAPYFLGSYGLGVLAHWARHAPASGQSASGHGSWAWLLLLMALVLGGLWLEWRSRLAWAGLTAGWLALGWGGAALARLPLQGGVRWLSRISYCTFLVHYPVSLVTNSLFSQLESPSSAVAFGTLVLTWLLSLLAGHAAHRAFEQAPASSRQPLLARLGSSRRRQARDAT